MNVNPQISFPPEVDFALISALIRDSCRLAFAMQTLDPPLDLAFASNGELYSDSKSVLRVERLSSSEFSQSLYISSLPVTILIAADQCICWLFALSTSRCHSLHLDDTHKQIHTASLTVFTLFVCRYRRSYDSEFTAPLVIHHVWPALMEGGAVVVKGEAVTRRGALVLTM